MLSQSTSRRAWKYTMSDYVRDIRKKIGSGLLFLQAASVLAFDDEGRVLLGQSVGGDWSTIGGAIEPGELPADAAVREFWEEAGALVSIVRVLGVFGGPEFFVIYPDGNQIAYTSIAFEARIISGQPKPDDIEFGKLGWFCADEIERLPMTANNRVVVRLAMAGREQPVHQAPTWRPS
jgi:8-oxo-dGTP pyrophosphatase MutT (NUDIX family)